LLDRFRDPLDPLKFLIVTARLLTGFDAPILQAMYLDKPMKEHNLLQAICRTNRPYPGKTHGLIVDYIGIFDDVARSLNFDEKSVQHVITNLDRLKADLPGALAQCLSYFPGLDRSIGGYEGLIAAQAACPTTSAMPSPPLFCAGCCGEPRPIRFCAATRRLSLLSSMNRSAQRSRQTPVARPRREDARPHSRKHPRRSRARRSRYARHRRRLPARDGQRSEEGERTGDQGHCASAETRQRSGLRRVGAALGEDQRTAKVAHQLLTPRTCWKLRENRKPKHVVKINGGRPSLH
jgi:hypothetical protein